MKISYLLLADASNQSDGKLNALGIGVRQYLAPSLPIRGRLVMIAAAEALSEEIGEHPLSIAIRTPKGKRQQLVSDKIQVETVPTVEGLPIVVTIEVGVPFPMEEEGRHVLQLTVGKARATYPFLVTLREQALP